MLKLRTGTLEDKDWENIAMAAGPLSKAKIYIDDTAGVTVMEMRSKCRRLKIEYGIDLIVIDYLQLMSGELAVTIDSRKYRRYLDLLKH